MITMANKLTKTRDFNITQMHQTGSLHSELNAIRHIAPFPLHCKVCYAGLSRELFIGSWIMQYISYIFAHMCTWYSCSGRCLPQDVQHEHDDMEDRRWAWWGSRAAWRGATIESNPTVPWDYFVCQWQYQKGWKEKWWSRQITGKKGGFDNDNDN